MPGGSAVAAPGAAAACLGAAVGPPGLLLVLLPMGLEDLPFSSGMFCMFSRMAANMPSLPRTCSSSLHATASTTAAREPSTAAVCEDCCSRRRSSLSADADVLRRMLALPAVLTSSSVTAPARDNAADAVMFRRMPPGDGMGRSTSICATSSPVAVLSIELLLLLLLPPPSCDGVGGKKRPAVYILVPRNESAPSKQARQFR
mmetsp:Transcript_33414/g.87980  ORF Transcript_33414/g.87980 Transcript_33414/m.87980 type:complete len:202 (+) Transcript_33414:964-1569(+)